MNQSRSLLIAALVIAGLIAGIGAVPAVAAAESTTTWTHTVNGAEETAVYTGTGTAEDPFMIDSLVDLQAIDKNSTTRGYHYHLEVDIDAVATRGWNAGAGFAPLTSFTGSFDGSGNVITDLHIGRSGSNGVALFGSTSSSASITGVHLENVSVHGRDNVGGLVGNNQGQIAGSSATGNVTGRNRVGGLIGNMGSKTARNSYADVSVDGNKYVGGFVGRMTTGGGEITGSFARGDVSGSDTVGGFVGQAGKFMTLSEMFFGSAGVDVRQNSPVCHDRTDITHDGQITRQDRVYISNSYASGNASGKNRGGFGGIVGEASVSNSFAIGQIPSGRLFGRSVKNQARSGGTGDPCPRHTIWRNAPSTTSSNNYASLDQLQGDKAANTGFDFENTWRIVTADDPRTDVDRIILRGIDENAQFDSAERLEIDDTGLSGVVAGSSGTFAVAAFDFANEPDTGVTVAVSEAGGIADLSGVTATTDESGTARFSFTETSAGSYTVTVENTEKPDFSAEASVTVVAAAIGATGSGGESGSINAVSARSAGAGASGTIAVEGTDRFGNPVAGATLSVDDNGSIAGLPAGTQVSTDASGIAEFSFTETTAGNYDVVVTDESGSVTQTVTVTVTSHPDGVSGGDGGSISVSGPASTSAGQQQSFAVTARDVYGNLVSGEDVSVTAPGGVSLANTVVTTDGSGVASFSITGETVGTYVIDFTDASGTFTDTASLSVTPDSQGLKAPGSSVTAVASPEAAAGADGEIALELADAFGNLLAGEEVVIADTGGLGGLTQGSATTANDSGIAMFSFSETTAGTYTIELAAETYDPDLYIGAQDARGAVTVTVTSAASGVGDSGSLEIDTTAVHYDEGRIRVTARDEFGNLVEGATVSIDDSSEIGGSGATAVTDAAGVAEIPFSETTAGTYALTVAAATGSITETATVTVLPHSEGLSGGVGGSITATAVPVDGATSEISITAVDAAGNRLAGETVELSDDGGLGLTAFPTATTDDTGAATRIAMRGGRPRSERRRDRPDG